MNTINDVSGKSSAIIDHFTNCDYLIVVKNRKIYIAKFTTITTMTETQCQFCSYAWETRVTTPKACPRCKRRFDYYENRYKIVNLKEMLKEAEYNGA